MAGVKVLEVIRGRGSKRGLGPNPASAIGVGVTIEGLAKECAGDPVRVVVPTDQPREAFDTDSVELVRRERWAKEHVCCQLQRFGQALRWRPEGQGGAVHPGADAKAGPQELEGVGDFEGRHPGRTLLQHRRREAGEAVPVTGVAGRASVYDQIQLNERQVPLLEHDHPHPVVECKHAGSRERHVRCLGHPRADRAIGGLGMGLDMARCPRYGEEGPHQHRAKGEISRFHSR